MILMGMGRGMEEEECQSRGSRRTRSQVEPQWTAQESLTLVNEIAAVEGECRKTLSSFQKWKIIVENCNALEVNRTLNQCRRKWDFLISAYKKIKLWESSDNSYWSLDHQNRRDFFGFPENFNDYEVFKAIDDHLKKTEEDGADTDPDNDPEAVDDAAPDSGFQKQKRRRMMHQKHSIEEMVKPQKRSTDKTMPPEQISEEEKVELLKHGKDDNVMLENNSIENKEQMMAAKLRENAELIIAIVKGNLDGSEDCVLADLKNVEASQTAFTRRQGDKLITCLGNLADTLDQLCDLVQECG